ncbi:hypothetical protein HDU96_006172 [Phlyctochytrium bullatum]|nr:hypothetical protein HDU96_006172 [Phlyctochytrium bullatum]
MILGKLLAIAAVIAGAAAGPPKIRGTGNPNKINNAYAIEFAAGVDSVAAVTSFLKFQKIVDVEVRTVINNKWFNGVSITINQDRDQDVVASIPQAKDIVHVHRIQRPRPVSVGTVEDLKFAPEGIHTITGVNDARAKLGLTGKGVKVAIIDTGVAYDHAALGGGFGPGYKVSFGYDVSFPIPLDPLHDGSHGTHVAGIVGADARNISNADWASDIPFTGVAPGATLGAYRVFGCVADSTSSDVMAKAIYMAAKDGADVINLSIGGGPAFSDGLDAVAAERVGADGHFVFGSNGNDGATGIFAGGSNTKADFSYNVGSNNGNFVFDQEYEVVVNNFTADELDNRDKGATAAAPTVNATGKALLIRWGDTAFGGSAKCYIAGSPLVPSLATDHKAGRQIIAAIKAGQTPKVVISQKVRNFALPTAGSVSDFSSPGLEQELNIKPDFGGIGGQVFSTISKHAQIAKNARTPYAVYSGTSMSSPYSAGVAALVLESYGRNRPTFDEFRTRLQNAAVPQKKFGSPAVDSVSYQGAGLINAYNAATMKTVVYPSRIALNDTANTKQHYELTGTVTNPNTVPVDYSVNHVTPFKAGHDATLTAANQAYTTDSATVLFSRNNDHVPQLNFTLAPSATKKFNVHFQAPSNAIAGLFPIFSGYIVVNSANTAGIQDKLASVPSLVSDAPIWSRKSALFDANLPQAAAGLEGLGIELADNATASTGLYAAGSAPEPPAPPSTPPPAIYKGKEWSKLAPLGIKRETRLLLVANESVSLNTPAFTPAGFPLVFDVLQRNSYSQGQSVLKPSFYIWSGLVNTNTTIPDQVAVRLPAGKYQVRFTALKHFGRVGSPIAGNDWDTILTPEFNLIY